MHERAGDSARQRPGLVEALQSLILDDLTWAEFWPGFAVVAVLGAVMLVLNVRMIERHD